MKEKSRPAAAGGLLPLSSPGSSWRGGTLGEVAKTKGGRIDPFSKNPEERLLAAGGDISLAPSKGNAGRVELGRGFENRVGPCP